MTSKQRGGTLDEFHARLKAEGRWDEYIAMKEEKALRRTEKRTRLRDEQAPLLADLRAAGFDVKSVWDFVNTSDSYPAAIPVLLKHLTHLYSGPIREGIGRALAVREARSAWPMLADLYRKEPTPSQPGRCLKDGLAVALSETVTDATMDELIALAKDRSHGESRLLLLSALKGSKLPIAKTAIAELADDPDLAKEIASWRLGAHSDEIGH